MHPPLLLYLCLPQETCQISSISVFFEEPSSQWRCYAATLSRALCGRLLNNSNTSPQVLHSHFFSEGKCYH